MTIEQQARVEQACEIMHDAYELAAKGAGWETNPASRKAWKDVPEANKVTMRAAVSALLGHLSSQAPGNLSEEEIERVAKEWLASEEYEGLLSEAIATGKTLALMVHCRFAAKLLRDHYLSGWVAVSIPPKFQKYYWVLLDKIPMWGTTDADRVMMYWYRGDGQWADQHGDDLMDISDHITHYADPVPPAPLP